MISLDNTLNLTMGTSTMKAATKLGLLSTVFLTLYGCSAELPPTDDNGNGNGNGSPSTATYVCGNARITKQDILTAINNARAQARSCGTTQYSAVPNVAWDDRLFLAADKHSKDMADNNFISHTGSDGSNFGQRIRAQGYSWRYAAENVAAGQPDLNSVVNGWLNSPGHCQNIMAAQAQDIGLSCRYDENTDYKMYWTLELGDTL